MTGVLILNYNNTCDIKNCILSILKHCDLDDIKLFVVDNGSNGTTKREVGDFLTQCFINQIQFIHENEVPSTTKKVTYLCLNKNLGYAKGNNRGIELILKDRSIEDILILNNDIILSNNIINELAKVRKDISNVGTISPLLVHPNGNIDYSCARRDYDDTCLLLTFSYFFSKKYLRLRENINMLKTNPELFNRKYFEIDMPSGSCMLISRDVIHKIGGFDENTFLYYEESILFERLKAINKRSYMVPSISCVHVGGATTNKTQTSIFLKRCNYESLVYYLKNYRRTGFLHLLYIHISANIRLFKMHLNSILRR